MGDATAGDAGFAEDDAAGAARDTGPGPSSRDGSSDTGSAVDASRPWGTIWLEAESGIVEAPMEVVSASDSSGGQLVTVDEAALPVHEIPPTRGRVTLQFHVPLSGAYRIWGRVIAPAEDSDSFWVRMDDGPYVKWNGIGVPDRDWQWDDVHDSDTGPSPSAVEFLLAEGDHTLEFAYREVGTLLDKVAITPDPTLVPAGLGE